MAVIPSGCLHGGVLLTERSELDEAPHDPLGDDHSYY